MTTSIRMDKDPSHMTERILDLTLKVIYLLTGEDCKLVKKMSGDPLTPSSCFHEASPVTEPPPHRLTSERKKKVLEVIQKMMELLTGEVPIRCQDVSVYFSMEEWEYLEGDRDLYKDVMMENEPPLTSPDGSSKRNPPERCPRPLYSRGSTQEDPTVPHHDQDEELRGIKVGIKELEEEELLVGGAQQSMEEGEMMMKSKQEESSLHTDTNGHHVRNTSEEHRLLSPVCNDITQHSPHVNPITHNRHPRHSHPKRSGDPSHPEESSDQSHTRTLRYHNTDTSTDPSNPKEPPLSRDGDHTQESSLSCSVCGKSFTDNKALRRHEVRHTAERPFSCSECGKSFIQKNLLLTHQRSHTGERPYSCSECGKCFIQRGHFLTHKRIHTDDRPYPCPECGKRFIQKRHFLIHQKTHTGERPYSCSECGKCFVRKGDFHIHQRIHKGERPYSCSECGKCFIQKGHFLTHQRIHTGERPYSCSECGKSFAQKTVLLTHQRVHTGERPYSCSKCGKYFIDKGNLNKHQRIHTPEKSEG